MWQQSASVFGTSTSVLCFNFKVSKVMLQLTCKVLVYKGLVLLLIP